MNFEIWFLGKAWGDPNGKPILGLHGWLDNAGTHDHIAPLLNEVGKGSHLKKNMIFHDILQKGGLVADSKPIFLNIRHLSLEGK